MECPRRYFWCLVVLCAVTPTRWGHAQTTKQHEIAAMLSSKIKRSIGKHHGGMALQEKTIERMAECTLIYEALAKQAPDRSARQGAAIASAISKDILFQISAGVSMDDFKKLSQKAHDLIMGMSKTQDRKRVDWLLTDCRSFLNLDKIDEAVEELAF